MQSTLEWIKRLIFSSEGNTEEQHAPVPNLDNLPALYLEEFGLSPITTQEAAQLLGRKEEEDGRGGELKKIEEAYKHWKDYNTPLLLTAEQGVGVTSLLNAALPLLPEPRYFLKDDERISTREELQRALTRALGVEEQDSLNSLAQVELDAPRVVVFENVERLLLRRIGGYDLLRDFLYFVNATKPKVFFIVSINDYSLYFLNRAMHFTDNFKAIEVGKLQNGLIKEIILRRNENFRDKDPGNKDFGMKFFETDEARHRRGKKEKPGQEALEEDFFKRLLHFAGGNISRAILFWLTAAKGIKEGKIYLKAPPVEPPQEVSLEELLVLEAVFQHTSLSYDEVEEVFRYSSYNGRLILDKLRNHGWLYPRKMRSGVQEYQVNFWYLHELKQLLKDELNRNIP